ncbi:hypothetical protein KM043_003387 [Ampulex compressa]|nr:hypothetical protein KM043_003387 [Ampulex compressa]
MEENCRGLRGFCRDRQSHRRVCWTRRVKMWPMGNCISKRFGPHCTLKLSSILLNRQIGPCVTNATLRRGKQDNGTSDSSLFKPVPVRPNPDDINVGAELSGNLKKADLQRLLTLFSKHKKIASLAVEYGLSGNLHVEALNHFKRYCIEADTLPTDLHVTLSDILQGVGNVTDIFPFYLRHAKLIFPHINCIDDLKKISDLRCPANWYPLARARTRKIIFHAGPTNSGKTYHALERFIVAKSGVYCGPLKLLAAEVFRKSNERGTPCDLITGEERINVKGEENPADHASCSVEMVNLNKNYEVAVIDEIQLMRDTGRGWAWTRALLGIPAEEIHICGEFAAVDLVTALCSTAGENVEVRKYQRLTNLQVENKALCDLSRVQPGDCIVCFNKNDIFTVSCTLERMGIEIAVIYGGLPPGTKLSQASKFNDPANPCKVLVATNAIGMGLNLHIRRIIFYSLIHPVINEKGEKEMNTISVSSALQIAGRAGRYGTQWEKGFVTSYKPEDLPTLQKLLKKSPEPINQAGLHPTPDQIELYGYHLPNATLSNLMDIFVSLCTVDDSLYFMCNMEDFKFLADMIQHVPLPLRTRYIFCCAPINKKVPFVCTMFLKFARQYSKNDAITFNWLCQQLGWPLAAPKNILDLMHLEAVFDVLDLYLWLSYRFVDLFPDVVLIRDIQKEIDKVIQLGIIRLAELLKRSETGISSGVLPVTQSENFELQTKKQRYYKGITEGRIGSRPEGKAFGERKLTDRLLAQGLLTPQMLKELQEEWSQEAKKENNRWRNTGTDDD